MSGGGLGYRSALAMYMKGLRLMGSVCGCEHVFAHQSVPSALHLHAVKWPLCWFPFIAALQWRGFERAKPGQWNELIEHYISKVWLRMIKLAIKWKWQLIYKKTLHFYVLSNKMLHNMTVCNKTFKKPYLSCYSFNNNIYFIIYYFEKCILVYNSKIFHKVKPNFYFAIFFFFVNIFEFLCLLYGSISQIKLWIVCCCVVYFCCVTDC